MKNGLQRYWSAIRLLFRHEQWNIGLVREPIQAFLRSDALPEIEWLPSLRANEYRADPFGVARDGRLFIFYEYFNYRTFCGTLHCLEHGGARSSIGSEIIRIDGHASYPYIFECHGSVYCVPETASEKRVDLYIADEFPYKWRYVKTLIPDFQGVDPTIVEYNGLWYLFCGAGNSGHDLYIWYAEDPLGVWHPHQQNPVKTSCSTSRPAGTPFIHNGYLYRPAQDGTKTYGGGIIIHKVSSLCPKEFKEEAYIALPKLGLPYPDGMHTLSSVGEVTLIDAKRYVFSIGALNYYLRRRFRKVARKLRVKIEKFASWSPRPS